MELEHAAIRIADPEATASFYEGALGLVREREVEGDDGTLHRYLRGEGGAALQVIHDPAAGSVQPAGIEHLAFRVEDVDDRVESIVDETGCPVAQPPTTVEALATRYAFLEDPDGYTVELFTGTE